VATYVLLAQDMQDHRFKA